MVHQRWYAFPVFFFVTMSGIASIGTATNSNLAGAGPSINITCRTDLTTISQFSLTDSDLKSGQHDIRRHELCVSVPQRQIQAYGAVFSFDPFVEMPVSLSVDVDFTKLPLEDNSSRLDMNISRYYRDVGDARNDLEYIMAKHQISLHSMTSDINNALLKMQDRLIAPATAAGRPQHFHRRNAVYLETNPQVFEIHDPNHGGRWTAVADIPTLYTWTSTDYPGVKHTNSLIFGLLIEMPDANTDLCTRTYDVESQLDMVIRHVMHLNEPKVHTSKNTKSAPITPPDLVYAGIALTDACAHPQNGDTAVTVNIFSALTVDNGPFSVLINDDLMWIHEIELADFEVDGFRRHRVVLDTASIAQVIFATTTVASQAKINSAYTRHTNARNRSQFQRPAVAFKNVPGNPSRKTFLIAPQKKGFGLLKRTSVKDRMRHIGTSISSCMPSKRLDLVNGAVAKF